MNKDELRKIFLTKRLALSEQEHRALSSKISDLFFHTFDLSRINHLHVFIPIKSKQEPDTWIMINRIRKDFPHIRLVVPRVKGDEMENIFFENNHQLGDTKWGMMEPKLGLNVPPVDIDMVIVPLLAVDQQGHRIGYGKGYYDRFLKLCRPDCIKVGVSFFEPEEAIKEKSSEDVLLNGCLTPNRYVVF
jgi:5-formyltetrahydrofolate cyclo-ligase